MKKTNGEMRWDPNDLVVWKNTNLLALPDLSLKQVKGIRTTQRVGDGIFSIESNGEVRKITIGAYYWHKATSQFAELKEGDTVDVTFLPYRWALGDRSGTMFYFYDIQKS